MLPAPPNPLFVLFPLTFASIWITHTVIYFCVTSQHRCKKWRNLLELCGSLLKQRQHWVMRGYSVISCRMKQFPWPEFNFYCGHHAKQLAHSADRWSEMKDSFSAQSLLTVGNSVYFMLNFPLSASSPLGRTSHQCSYPTSDANRMTLSHSSNLGPMLLLQLSPFV